MYKTVDNIKALLHSDKESSHGMQIVTYVISFYKVIHEYKVRRKDNVEHAAWSKYFK